MARANASSFGEEGGGTEMAAPPSAAAPLLPASEPQSDGLTPLNTALWASLVEAAYEAALTTLQGGVVRRRAFRPADRAEALNLIASCNEEDTLLRNAREHFQACKRHSRFSTGRGAGPPSASAGTSASAGRREHPYHERREHAYHERRDHAYQYQQHHQYQHQHQHYHHQQQQQHHRHEQQVHHHYQLQQQQQQQQQRLPPRKSYRKRFSIVPGGCARTSGLLLELGDGDSTGSGSPTEGGKAGGYMTGWAVQRMSCARTDGTFVRASNKRPRPKQTREEDDDWYRASDTAYALLHSQAQARAADGLHRPRHQQQQLQLQLQPDGSSGSFSCARELPVEALRRSAREVPVEALRRSARELPVEALRKSAREVPVEAVRKSARELPVEAVRKSARELPVEALRKSARELPVEAVRKCARELPVEALTKHRTDLQPPGPGGGRTHMVSEVAAAPPTTNGAAPLEGVVWRAKLEAEQLQMSRMGHRHRGREGERPIEEQGGAIEAHSAPRDEAGQQQQQQKQQQLVIQEPSERGGGGEINVQEGARGGSDAAPTAPLKGSDPTDGSPAAAAAPALVASGTADGAVRGMAESAEGGAESKEASKGQAKGGGEGVAPQSSETGGTKAAGTEAAEGPKTLSKCSQS